MLLVERHVIKASHKKFKEIDNLAFQSKNLFNSALYVCRQSFFTTQTIPTFNKLYHQLKTSEAYKALPSKVAQLVILQVSKSFESYFEAMSAYEKNPDKFLGKPKLPRYKDKLKGRNILIFNYQAVSRKWLKKGFINPSGLTAKFKTKQNEIKEVRLIPKGNIYILEVVYVDEVARRVQEVKEEKLNDKVAAIDLGINNLATVSSNCLDFKPFIVCGKALKACNQQYNKVKSILQSSLPKNKYTSRKIEALTQKRNNQVDYYLHTASRFIINQLVQQGVRHLILGKNDNWKQDINLGKKTNQNFTCIPHARFIQILEYKAQLVGIKVTIIEESYTSKCSFLDLEPIKKQEKYQGKRIKRGLFRASNGQTYNADLNGSLNILRKVVGDSVFSGKPIERLVVSPIRFRPYKAKSNVCP